MRRKITRRPASGRVALNVRVDEAREFEGMGGREEVAAAGDRFETGAWNGPRENFGDAHHRGIEDVLVLALQDLEEPARRYLPRPIFGYVSGGAETNAALRGRK